MLIAGTSPPGAEVRPGADPTGERIIGMTAPSDKATLAPLVASRIEEITTREGSMVSQGEVLIVLDDALQRLKTEMAGALAESDWNVELARLKWEWAKQDVAKLTSLHGDAYASSKELQDALMLRGMRRTEWIGAQLQHDQDRKVYARERARLSDYRLLAPFSGYVVSVLKKQGETVAALEPVVTLMKLNPLEVNLDCPVARVPRLSVGDRFTVLPVDPQWAPRPGVVQMVSRVADSASQTVKVKLLVPNEDARWLVGLKVKVDFSRRQAKATSVRLSKQLLPNLATESDRGVGRTPGAHSER